MPFERYSWLTTVTALSFFTAGSTVAQAADIQVSSPDRTIVLSVATNGPLTYQVKVKGQTALAPSALGVTIDGQNLGQNVSFGKPTTRSVKETYAVYGVHPTALNQYQETILPATTGSVKWTLEVRAYNDGVAYRYRVPGSGSRQISGEASTWTLPQGSTLWYQSNKNKDYEAPYQSTVANPLTSGMTLAAPATAKLPGSLGYALLTEANLVGYSDMALEVTAPNTLKALFHNDTTGWTANGEVVSPWRVTLLARDLNRLVNSNLIQNLCPAPSPELAKAEWIKPGRSAWHWLVTGPPKLDEQEQWVRRTKSLGFEYYLIDDGWKRWKDGDKDAWSCLRDITSYARTQNVGIFAWVNSNELLTPEARAAYFQKAKEIGLVGLKIDFPKPPNSEWVQWYDDTLRDMAKHKLMVDFHGAVKPTGRERTWPHELTREAIRGRENGKQTPLHDTTLPFLRYVQGPGDFTPGELRPERMAISTWGHEIAQAIVYTSPFLCYGGRLEDYRDNPAADLIRAIPATWDETLVLPGSEIGEVAAYARRTGNDWFVGVINGGETRTMPLSLSFLGKGTYYLEQFADTDERKDSWLRTEKIVTSKETLSATMRPSGGFVARLSPKPFVQTPAAQTAPVPPETWREHWFEHNQQLKRVAYDDDIAVYFDNEVPTEAAKKWIVPFMTKLWRYTKATYGPFGNEGANGGRLYTIFHQGKYSGGHPSTYVDASHDFRNVTDCGPGPFDTPKYDVPSHEVAHIVEGASRGVHGTPPWEIWHDSKWAEFFQYDAYVALGMNDDAKRLYDKFMAGSDNFPRANTHWFRDWFYPLWQNYGHGKVMANFFRLTAEHFPKAPEGKESGTKPGTVGYTRQMNWGEYIHFMSGAAGEDLKPMATKAFGWPADWETQFQKAKKDFPGISYKAAKPE
jgi:alpha-glucosidase